MRVVFMGTPDFSVGTLEALLASRHEVCAVVTQPDKPKGRGKAMQFPPVKEVAVRAEIPVYQPRRVRDPEFVETLRGLGADVIVVVAFGQIIPQTILELTKYGCINVHASLLPKYRGAAPIQWAVINGERESGVTTMQMDAGLDTGDMLLKTVVPLDAEETGGSLFAKLSGAGAALLLETLDGLEAGTIVPQKQGETTTEYAKMLTKDMGRIDWSRDAAAIQRLVRGLNPWPSAYTQIHGKNLKIWKARVLPEESASAFAREEKAAGAAAREAADRQKAAVPGTVLAAEGARLWIQTGQGILSVEELQLEGKKRMDTAAFLRGYAIKEETILCS